MVKAGGSPLSSPARLEALAATALLDSPQEEAFDRTARLAQRIFGAPVAMISLIDSERQFLKSAPGLAEPWASAREIPLTHSFCKHVVMSGAGMAVTDARRHALLHGSPGIEALGLTAYLGTPLCAPGGEALGALCVADFTPRAWSADDLAILAELSQGVTAQIAAHMHRRRSERAEAALQANEARTAEILESMDEAFYAVDRDWRLLYANSGAERFWGQPRNKLLGRSMFKLFPNFSGSHAHQAHERALTGGKPLKVETISTATGVPVELNLYPSPSGLSVFFRDISDRQRMERELRERDDILTLAERSAGIGVWDMDLVAQKVRGTPQFFRIMGLEPQESVSIEALRELRHPDDREHVVEGYNQAVAAGEDSYETEYRTLRPDGETRWIFGRGRVIRDASGAPVRYSGIDIDVTERRAAEAALAESEERLRLAQEAAGMGAWDWDIRTGTLRWSDAEYRLHGIEEKPERLTFHHWAGALHPEDRERAHAVAIEAIAARSRYETEYRVPLPDGSVRWIAGRGTVLTDEAGRPTRLLGVSVDVTERKAAAEALARMNEALEARVRERTAELEAEAERRAAAEAQLHQAQKMEAVGQLTGGIAHDFNNLLTIIIGNLEVLRRRLAKEGTENVGAIGPRISGPIDMAIQGATNAAQLTHRLLAFSRRQPLAPRAVDMNKLVSGMYEMIDRTLSEAIEVETFLAPTLWPTYADPNQLESALLNLVVNARDAMPDGGRLAIETANVHLDDAAVAGAAVGGDYVMLGVADTGCGIPNELQARVFEPFFTTKDTGKGSGLGLSMIYGFASQSGGFVRLASEVGVGTTIRIYLPRHGESTERGDHASPGAGASGNAIPRARPGETVLLVEDNEGVRRYGVSALQELGYSVIEAADGAEALGLLDGDKGRHVDLLFTDIVLPGGMNGRALAEAVAAKRPGLPVLLTTGYAPAAAGEDGVAARRRLLGKPYDVSSLALHVREAIDARSQARPNNS